MNSAIEEARQTAEDVDLYEATLTQLLLSLSTPNRTHRDKLSTQHRARDLTDRILHRSQSLLATFTPDTLPHQERTAEIDALAPGGTQGADLAQFYSRLAKVKEYHRKYPDVASTLISGHQHVDFSALEGGDEEWLDRNFTGEEGLGRYLDLHQLHEAWNNLSPASTSGNAASGGWKRTTYLQYLPLITQFQLSPTLKSSPAYSTYLTNLLQYLSSFYEKLFPLGDLDHILKTADVEFAKKWDAGEITGWSNVEEEATTVDGTWCAACQKSYSKETVYAAHLTSKKHEKAAAKLSTTDAPTNGSAPSTISLSALRQQKNRALALKEALIYSLVSPLPTDPPTPLAQILTDTLSNTERRAALTDRERATEIEELEAREAAEAAAAAAAALAKAPENEEEEDDGRIYNPLKLPLGWDGKPIPFWLYKLHGLGVEFKCEICSDFIYMGRKTFERHFQESRHAFGMRALGLPNTKHFHEITRIEDAIALAEKLKQEGKQEVSQTEMMEELEDEDGNVYNRKTYDDLKRQGLL